MMLYQMLIDILIKEKCSTALIMESNSITFCVYKSYQRRADSIFFIDCVKQATECFKIREKYYHRITFILGILHDLHATEVV